MGNNNKTIKVEKNEIIQLRTSANGFKHSFFVIYNSYKETNTYDHHFWDEANIMSVTGTVGLFAIELQLKFLTVVGSYSLNSTNNDYYGEHMIEHNLKKLYNKLKQISPKIVNSLENEFNNEEKINLYDFIDNCYDQFTKWRYSYSEKSNISIHLNQLATCLNLLYKYSLDEFRRIDDSLSKTINYNSTSNESMQIDLNREIVEEDY